MSIPAESALVATEDPAHDDATAATRHVVVLDDLAIERLTTASV